LIQDDALVVDSMPYRDRDLILSLLTPSVGVVRGVLRGARAGKHPRAGSTQLLSLIRIVAFQSRHAEMATVRNVDLVTSSFPLASDLARSAAAAVAAELLVTFCPQGEPAPRRFRLGVAALNALLDDTDPGAVVAYLQFWCLLLGGVMPPLEQSGLEERDLEFLLLCRSQPVNEIEGPPPPSTVRWLDETIRGAAERPLKALRFLRAMEA
jgi:DNA repair protein RecO